MYDGIPRPKLKKCIPHRAAFGARSFQIFLRGNCFFLVSPPALSSRAFVTFSVVTLWRLVRTELCAWQSVAMRWLWIRILSTNYKQTAMDMFLSCKGVLWLGSIPGSQSVWRRWKQRCESPRDYVGVIAWSRLFRRLLKFWKLMPIAIDSVWTVSVDGAQYECMSPMCLLHWWKIDYTTVAKMLLYSSVQSCSGGWLMSSEGGSSPLPAHLMYTLNIFKFGWNVHIFK